MKAIVNVNKEWGIGSEGDLLINLPEDMKFFRKTTAGKIVIMGRKTLESFPGMKPLVGRINIVLTSDASRIKAESRDAANTYVPDITAEESSAKLRELTDFVLSHQELPAKERPTVLVAAKTVQEVLDFCAAYPEEEQYVIGGASIYETMLPYCSQCIVTINDADLKPDTYFPNLDAKPEWEHSEVGEMKEHEGVHFHFDTFNRI